MTKVSKKTGSKSQIIWVISFVILVIMLHLGTKENTKKNYAGAGNFLSSKGQTKSFNPIPAKLRWE